jgi:hypothetical protein
MCCGLFLYATVTGTTESIEDQRLFAGKVEVPNWYPLTFAVE